MSQEMCVFRIPNKKTHNPNACVQNYKISLRDKHIFQERKIVRRILKGMTNEEIANHLNIGVNTVKSYRLRLFKKLNVNNITEAITVINNYHQI